VWSRSDLRVIVEPRLIVERSTAAPDWMDGVETGWTEQHDRGVERSPTTITTTLPRWASWLRIPSSTPIAAYVMAPWRYRLA